MKYLTKSWWRTAPVTSMADAQASLDRWSVEVADQRKRLGATVGKLGAAEPLRVLPVAAYPAVITVRRKASRSALVAFEGLSGEVCVVVVIDPVLACRVGRDGSGLLPGSALTV